VSRTDADEEPLVSSAEGPLKRGDHFFKRGRVAPPISDDLVGQGKQSIAVMSFAALP
jgi:hypothetical protein